MVLSFIRSLFSVASVALLVNLPGALAAQEQAVVPLPEGFALGHSAQDQTGSLREFVPQGEAVTNWTQMLTVRNFIPWAGASPVQFHERMMSLLGDSCPGGAAQEVRRGVEFGHEIHVIIVGCPDSTIAGGEEWFISKAIGGVDALYVVQGAWRGEATEDLITRWSNHLAQVFVCTPGSAAAPCPE